MCHFHHRHFVGTLFFGPWSAVIESRCVSLCPIFSLFFFDELTCRRTEALEAATITTTIEKCLLPVRSFSHSVSLSLSHFGSHHWSEVVSVTCTHSHRAHTFTTYLLLCISLCISSWTSFLIALSPSHYCCCIHSHTWCCEEYVTLCHLHDMMTSMAIPTGAYTMWTTETVDRMILCHHLTTDRHPLLLLFLCLLVVNTLFSLSQLCTYLVCLYWTTRRTSPAYWQNIILYLLWFAR